MSTSYSWEGKAGMAHSDCGWTCGCAGKTVKSLENTCHTWALLRWLFITKRCYIPLPFNSGEYELSSTWFRQIFLYGQLSGHRRRHWCLGVFQFTFWIMVTKWSSSQRVWSCFATDTGMWCGSVLITCSSTQFFSSVIMFFNVQYTHQPLYLYMKIDSLSQ